MPGFSQATELGEWTGPVWATSAQAAIRLAWGLSLCCDMQRPRVQLGLVHQPFISMRCYPLPICPLCQSHVQLPAFASCPVSLFATRRLRNCRYALPWRRGVGSLLSRRNLVTHRSWVGQAYNIVRTEAFSCVSSAVSLNLRLSRFRCIT